MATVVAAKLGSESGCAGSSDGIPAVHRLQMAVADTECAQALLELAMSIVPNPPSPSCAESPQREPTNSDMVDLLSSGSSSGSPQSLLKRRAESPLHFEGCCSASEESSAELQRRAELQQHHAELIKCIKLDHNYCCTADDRKSSEVILEPDQFKTYCESIKQHGSVPVSMETSLENDCNVSPSQGTQSSDKENSFDNPKNIPEMSHKTLPQGSNVVNADVSKSPKSQIPNENKKNSNLAANPKSKCDKKNSCTKQKAIKKKEIPNTRHTNFDSQVVLLQRAETKEPCEVKLESNVEGVSPDGEEKFHNFQLLLKCLVANEPQRMAGSPPPLDWPGRQETPRTLSMSSEENDERPSGSTSDCEKAGQGDHSSEYPCKVCKKIFSKKRYLTKHVLRMHPLQGSEQEAGKLNMPEDGSTCPHCHVVIRLKKDLHRHVTNCGSNPKRCKKPADIDRANCQFCGVRMRRHLLVRHLADQHCVDPDPKDSLGKKSAGMSIKTVRSLIDSVRRNQISPLESNIQDGQLEMDSSVCTVRNVDSTEHSETVIRDPMKDNSTEQNDSETVIRDPMKDNSTEQNDSQTVIRDPMKDNSTEQNDSQTVIRDPMKDNCVGTSSSHVPIDFSDQVCQISLENLQHKKADIRPATVV